MNKCTIKYDNNGIIVKTMWLPKHPKSLGWGLIYLWTTYIHTLTTNYPIVIIALNLLPDKIAFRSWSSSLHVSLICCIADIILKCNKMSYKLAANDCSQQRHTLACISGAFSTVVYAWAKSRRSASGWLRKWSWSTIVHCEPSTQHHNNRTAVVPSVRLHFGSHSYRTVSHAHPTRPRSYDNVPGSRVR